MNLFLIFLLLGYQLIGEIVTAQDERIHFVDNEPEGQTCEIGNSTVVGKCRPIAKCSTVDIKKITFCPSEIRYLPQLVCCPELQTTNRLTTRISQQMCDEYKNIPKETSLRTVRQLSKLKTNLDFGGRVEPQVVGGIDTVPAEYPHMAAIGWRAEGNEIKWNCGGTLISQNYVVTAAHCTLNENVAPDVVRISEHNLRSKKFKNAQQFNISKIIVHPNYSFSSVYDDVALIKLKGRVVFSYAAQPACLWQTQNISQNTAVATGWGTIGYLDNSADILQKVTLDIIPNELCKTFLQLGKRFLDGLRSTQMCAGILSGGKDTCQGDSGGPLQIKPIGDEIFYIIGITSFGKFCGAQNSPGGYTRISSYLDWIENIVWQQKN